MAQGLQVFDAEGNPTLNVTDRLCKILGKLDTGDFITDMSTASDSLYLHPEWWESAAKAYENGNAFWALPYAIWWPTPGKYRKFIVPNPVNIGTSIMINIDRDYQGGYAYRVIYLCGVY